MDLLTFVAEIVKALAWPAAIFGLVFLLKQPIAQLIPTIQKLKYKELAIEFGRRVEEAAVEAGDSLPPPHEPRALPPARIARFAELAKSSPRAAVLESWLEIESAMLDLTRKLNLRLGDVPARSPSHALRAIQRAGRLDEAAVATIHDLRTLRNEAVHYPDFAITPESALTYANTALAVADVLRNQAGAA